MFPVTVIRKSFVAAISTVFVLLISFLVPANSFAQYPFEKYKATTYTATGNWQTSTLSNPKRMKATAQVTDGTSKYIIRLENRQLPSDTFTITASTAGGKRQHFLEPWSVWPESMQQPVRSADLNGDGISDLKLVVNAVGGGAVPGLVRLIYLFGQPSGEFIKVSFLSFNDGPERDFDNDGRYEMVVRDLVSHKSHSYWAFNVFSFRNGQFQNVSRRYGYPILVQFLNRPNYKVTDKVSAKESEKFLVSQPREFDLRK
jgi:hypothetical protein